jgi:DNA-binding CsgD family transcriptional regulator
MEKLTQIHNSKHLKINYDKINSLFIQEWNHNSPLETKEFRGELLEFKKLFSVYKPQNILWLQEDFATNLSTVDQIWIEENVNIDCFNLGLKKCAFVVGKDVIAQILVFNFFTEVPSCLSPKHFGGKNEALKWLIHDYLPPEFISNDFDIKFNGKTENGKSRFIIETSSESTEATLKSFNRILKENAFTKENKEKFKALTNREKEVFYLYANGEVIKKIAENLFLSELTVRTHWRNTKKKLDIKSLSDITNYKNCFLR